MGVGVRPLLNKLCTKVVYHVLFQQARSISAENVPEGRGFILGIITTLRREKDTRWEEFKTGAFQSRA